MTVRSPLYWDTVNNDMRSMTTAQVTDVCERMVYQYSLDPSVILSRVATGGNAGDVLTDTRMQAGAASIGTVTYVAEAATADISQVSLTYDHVNQTTNGPQAYPSDANLSYPVYWDATAGEIKAMTQQDMIDTFVDEAIGMIASGNGETDTGKKGGSYTISTSNSLAGATLVSADPIFIDTRADTTLFTSAGIPESLDQPIDINNYYLHRFNGDATAGAIIPLAIDITGGVTDLRAPPAATWDNFLGGFVKYAAESEAGYQLSYFLKAPDGSGTLCGSAIADTRLNGTSATGYTTRFVGVDDYRSQEFPNGVATTISTYGLYVTRT
jgi:hypothetical protein